MQKRRLLKLADLLDADARNKKGVKFDLGEWGYQPDGGEIDETKPFPVDCSTAACAVGLACISRAFKRSGLDYIIKNDRFVVPTFDGAEGYEAAEAFFGLDYTECRFLFNKDNYPFEHRRGAVGERAVAKRIRKLVAGKVTATAV